MPSTGTSRWFSQHTLFWLLLHSGLWLLLAGTAGWYIGAPSVIAATALSVSLGSPTWPVRLVRLPRFLQFFLRALLSGGWDVARRALQPRLSLTPHWARYPLTIHQPRHQRLLACIVGLLPGTLAAAVEDDALIMHVLDDDLPWQQGVAQLEQQLMHLLGEEQQT